MRILYVEDDARIRETTGDALRRKGYRVHDEARCCAAVDRRPAA